MSRFGVDQLGDILYRGLFYAKLRIQLFVKRDDVARQHSIRE
jgi:hypothetical protein